MGIASGTVEGRGGSDCRSTPYECTSTRAIAVTMHDDVMDALIRAMILVDHPYQQRQRERGRLDLRRSHGMRTIETALWPPASPAANVGVGVFLGDVTLPPLADLVEGERVTLEEPSELQAKATSRVIELDGRLVWFAEIDNPDAIEATYPDSSDAPASIRHPAKA